MAPEKLSSDLSFAADLTRALREQVSSQPRVQVADPKRQPASFIPQNRLNGGGSNSSGRNEQVQWNDIPGVAPNYGRYLIPHVFSFQGMYGGISNVYRTSDEALRHSLENARSMRN